MKHLKLLLAFTIFVVVNSYPFTRCNVHTRYEESLKSLNHTRHVIKKLVKELDGENSCSVSAFDTFRRKYFFNHFTKIPMNAAKRFHINTVVLRQFSRHFNAMSLSKTVSGKTKKLFKHVKKGLRRNKSEQDKIHEILVKDCKYKDNTENKVDIPFNTLSCLTFNHESRLKTLLIELKRIYHAMEKDIKYFRLTS